MTKACEMRVCTQEGEGPTDGQTADRITILDGDGLAVACQCYWLNWTFGNCSPEGQRRLASAVWDA